MTDKESSVMIRHVKFFTIVVVLLFPVLLAAQEDIKVESFTLSTTTNYANLEGHIEYDNNGEKCALIIVDTRNPELLTFDGGSTGIMKSIIKTGQVWLYVPDGLKRITDRQILGVPEPEEIADAILFLLSDASGTITGRAMHTDSGIF